ncbi:hypothetical protein OHV05_35825 (plasmid) [Kitasatospora sp. NBC_00070]|uniref:hypothetical protein n=1 Tax=Kitasatospora sp. NBC_00070 TaxID=2975962 RepID=UPI002F908A95
MARPIPSMPPGKKLGYFVDSTIKLLGERSDLPTVYTFTVDAVGPFGPVKTGTYVVDLNVRRGSLINPETVVGKLNEISDTLKSWGP